MNRKPLIIVLVLLLVTSVGCESVMANREAVSAGVVSEPEIRLELGIRPTETVAMIAPEREFIPTALMAAVAKVAPKMPAQISAALPVVTVGSIPVVSPTGISTPTIVPQPTGVPTEMPTSIPTPSAPGGPTCTPTETPTPTPSAPGGPEKKIVVDLSDQVLYAYEGEVLVFSVPVSTGLARYPTLVGEFRIYVKILKYKMEGGSKEEGTYYYLENVPHIQYFWGHYGLHGAYWHNNFGHPMSRGCVNLSLPDAEWLFDWTDPVLPEGATLVYATEDNPGTLVIVQE